MTIRRTLLIAFVSVGLGSAVLLAGLAFVKAQDALQTEIERSIGVQAVGISAEIDKMMFERFQNAATWMNLDIMQDVQIRDVDKRLSSFLADMRAGYGDVYLNLVATDDAGRIISSSDPARIGKVIANSKPRAFASMSSSGIDLDFIDLAAEPAVWMSSPIAAKFRSGNLGRLHLQLDWTRFSDVLDQASGPGGRSVVVLDHAGRIIAASAALRRGGMLGATALSGWRVDRPAVSLRSGAPLIDKDVLVASGHSPGFATYPGFGWTTLVIQPADEAFAPVRRMGLIFTGLLGLVLLATTATALWISGRIAHPITALTDYARAYSRNRALATPPAAGPGEVGELTDAFVSMVRDIAQSQQNLVRASKLAVVGEMSAIIAHEVRTPLGILRSSAQMLRRETHLSNDGQELLGFIESETERLNRLVSAMLDTARPRNAVYAEVDLHALIHGTALMLRAQAERQEVVVSERFAATRAIVTCDGEQITQVILNVLMNGLQVLAKGGRIEISTRDLGRNLCVEFADDGPGIDPLVRDRIFEAFFFQREGGIGLGLAIVQQIVVAHDGVIEATQSTLGGALFRILLPYERLRIP